MQTVTKYVDLQPPHIEGQLDPWKCPKIEAEVCRRNKHHAIIWY